MLIYLIRHGETEENRQRILQGHMPGTLTENGREQMTMTAERLAKEDVRFTRIVASDLKRAMDSARIIADKLALPIVPLEILRERNWGRFNGIPIAEAKDKYFKNGELVFPDDNAETEADIRKRARMAIEELRKRFAGETIIVVTHGQIARHIIAAHFDCGFHEIAPLLNAEARSIRL
ncbi:MAG: histidine phosphatase family protein [Bacteroidaceae bacterium]|nr:histidine phosphatase family protein [Bacteroidaceae bacterium]